MKRLMEVEMKRKVYRLKELKRETLNTEGLELEVNVLKSKLKDPKKVEEIKSRYRRTDDKLWER